MRKIQLDENLSRTLADYLVGRGFDVETVVGEGLSGIIDTELWAKVCEEDRLLVTADLGFADIRKLALGNHPGVLLLRTRRPGRNTTLDVLKRVVLEFNFDWLFDCLIVADERRTRIRRTKANRKTKYR